MRQMKSYKSLIPVLLVLFLATITTPAPAQTFNVLYTFHGSDGGGPVTQLTFDGKGNLYGTTSAGGSGNCTGPGCGTVFAINRFGKLLGSFSFNRADGWEPMAGVYRDSAGILWGTTVFGGNFTDACGGSSGPGCGVVFKLTPQGKETAFKLNGPPGPWGPEAQLVGDGVGNLYGTTYLGGGRGDGGTAFKLDTRTGKGTLLHIFPPGSNPYAGMILLNGNLYGTTFGLDVGTVYQMTTSGQVTTIATLDGSTTGILATDAAGNLYGTTQDGGSNNCDVGCGTVFKLSPNGNGGWTNTTLYVFCQDSGCADGESPKDGPLAVDSAGNVYGTTIFGGTSGDGVIFKLDVAGNETVLHNFTGGADGAFPFAGLAIDSAGNLYGTAEEGGNPNCPVDAPYGCGVVYEITP
jgi:uncharacterized repeat protein (TIGR03803 family)